MILRDRFYGRVEQKENHNKICVNYNASMYDAFLCPLAFVAFRVFVLHFVLKAEGKLRQFLTAVWSNTL